MTNAATHNDPSYELTRGLTPLSNSSAEFVEGSAP
jgi:hypothetical protein